MKIQLIDEKCMPKYKNIYSICMDCRARTDIEWVWEKGLKVAYIPLGFKVKVPRGYILKLYAKELFDNTHIISISDSTSVFGEADNEEITIKLIHHSISIDTPPNIKKHDIVCQMTLIRNPIILLDTVDHILEYFYE